MPKSAHHLKPILAKGGLQGSRSCEDLADSGNLLVINGGIQQTIALPCVKALLLLIPGPSTAAMPRFKTGYSFWSKRWSL
jgi:hypothetical protein